MSAVKTAISIDKRLYEQMEKLSKRRGVSRSNLYAQAVAAYLDRQRTKTLRDQLNEAYDTVESGEEKQFRGLAAGSFRRLVEGTW